MSHQGNAGQNRESGYSANRGYRGKSNNYNASYSRHGGDHPGSTNRSGQHFDQHGPRRGANQDPSSHLSQSQRNQHYEPGSNAQNPSNFIRGNFSQDRHHNLQYSGSHAPSTGGQYQISQYDGQVDAGFRGRSSRFDRAGNDLSNDHFGDQAIVYLSVPPEWGANTVSNIDRDGDTVMENGSDSNVWASYNISRYSHLMG
ncbi:hypothetical protein N7478_009428 [Penicillium angulare]|uniref:uncharacterized protein n=1 Tax=Penicillium angulare TaxID=116970 RepID=UPI00254264A0|nr:uncharacterized protein N7478_009428 [Penicillium angulare]KAJ5266620.1 hypothetical protein N7478_009428 [Penicillium angulare]